VAVCIRVFRDLRARQCWKGRDDAKSEWSYVAEKDCPATGVIGLKLKVAPTVVGVFFLVTAALLSCTKDYRGYCRCGCSQLL